MSLARYLLVLCFFVSLPVTAQVSTGCRIPAQDRAVAICAPPEGTTITDNNGTQPFGVIRDSLPHSTLLYIDGNPNGAGVSERGISTDIPGVTIIEAGGFVMEGEGWHTITLAVFDDQGSFRDTVRFRLSGMPQCSIPTTDQTIKICSPLPGRQLISPIHFSIVANSSVPIRATEISVDRGQFGTIDFRANAGGFENSLPSQHGNTLSVFIPIPVGTHTAMVKVIQTDNHTFQKTFTFEVLPFEECCK